MPDTGFIMQDHPIFPTLHRDTPKRPDLRAYFRSRIDAHVRGMLSGPLAPLPRGVDHVEGNVTDPRIVAVMDDGTRWHWQGGRYAARKVAGCYAPLMPTPMES